LVFVPSNIINLNLLNGQSITQTVQVLNGIAGGTYPVRFKLFWGTTDCCYFEKSYTLPPCNDSCGCGQWEFKNYTIEGDTTHKPLECNTSIVVPGGANFNMLGNYLCNPNDTALCKDSYDITTKDLNTGTIANVIQTGSLNYSFPVVSNYQVMLKVFCGGKLCDSCRFIIKKGNTGKPEDTKLMQNYPNPFNPVTQISFFMPLDARVSIKLYDVTGRLVTTLINNELRTTGMNFVEFDGTNYASGIYFYRLETEGFSDTKKMLIVK
jgi:hypothetical protein